MKRDVRKKTKRMEYDQCELSGNKVNYFESKGNKSIIQWNKAYKSELR